LFNLRRENGEWQGGWKHKREMTTANYSSDGFNTLYECVEPGEKGYGSIVLEDSAYNLLINTAEISHPEKKTRLMANGIRELFHIINDATRSYLQKEQHFFERYRAERTEELIDCIEKLISMIPDDDSSCLIKMSAGVGYHSIIGDWKYTDYTATGEWESGKNVGKHKYKSRKTAEYKGRLMLMGFVKLSCLSGSDADSIAGELQEEHQEIIDNIMTPILEREKARLEAEAEERLRLEMRAAEERRKDTYLQLMQNAKTLFDENRWNDAIAKAQEAAAVCPESTEHIPFIEQCNKAKDIADYETEQKDKDKALFQKELSFVLQGKTSVGNIIGTTAKWLKYNHTFGECELQVLTDCLKGMPTKEIKKKRKDLEKAIQQEWANKVLIALGIQ
jgi:hypothetical protein